MVNYIILFSASIVTILRKMGGEYNLHITYAIEEKYNYSNNS